MTLSGLLREGREALQAAGIPEWDLDAWYLLEYAAHCTKNEYFLRPEKEVLPQEKQLYRTLIRKRSAHIPLQYLTGSQEFMGLSFFVDENVLIPRQDTEILVEEALRALGSGMRVLDVCTGSGCILLSLLKLCAGLEGTGTDLSEKALQVAGENARRLGVEASFVQGDLFEPVSGKYDCIVSNPPYIASREVDVLMEEVRDHEPRMALDGGEDGLYFYRKIAAQSPKYLKDRGRIFLEIGFDQGEAVAGLLVPAFDEVRIVQDLAGLDRVVCGILRS
ncbi:protein-(glutamine-N5) methyltransferase, release factor-specific [Lachnoclostridium sp. An196]|uniref:peptide chain release factor N(5)-glutamine methyltransferase n=1 Tax=Lachnoclostridium sp. An196 TaxID=1965583 RepID=UPI000B37890A|nr:peptide chain release factor N(5)-glutamine methyltransferase [Lachnoclostridium sp. An196]OUP22296.1 protein-(glutamine-N5) methyltransferase, release factor-specific [Lachnoclostridium sp. An196]